MNRILATLASLCILTTAAWAGPYYHPAPRGGLDAYSAIAVVRLVERQGRAVAFPTECWSSCAIQWDVAKNKCVLSPDGVITLVQHKFDGSGNPIYPSGRYYRRSAAAWKAVAAKGQPASQFVDWELKGKPCPPSAYADGGTSGFNGAGMRRDPVCAGNPNCWRRKRTFPSPR